LWGFALDRKLLSPGIELRILGCPTHIAVTTLTVLFLFRVAPSIRRFFCTVSVISTKVLKMPDSMCYLDLGQKKVRNEQN
jgi:hypothetical protein